MLTRYLCLPLVLALLAACSADEASVEPMMEPMAEPVMEDAADVPESFVPPSPGRRQAGAKAGVLTAGDIDDGLNAGAFARYLKRAARELRLPVARLGDPIRLQFVDPWGRGAPGVRVTLRRRGAADPFWSGYSGVDGRLTIFPALHGVRGMAGAEARVFGDAQQEPVIHDVAQGAETALNLPFRSKWQPGFMDLVFVVDATGSMDDELDWLTRDLTRIVASAQRAAPGMNIRYGLIVYRDRGDDYVVRNFGFTDSADEMQRWLEAQQADGGGDYPEAAAPAMIAAAALPWRRGKGERLLFHVADAPPHARDARDYLTAAEDLARRDVQVFGLGASGVAAESEFLMRQASAMSQGRYLFLTDDSGVGHAHAEPTIGCYRVTKLSGLVERVLYSELSGRRLEAADGDVIREVGTYRRGVCLN